MVQQAPRLKDVVAHLAQHPPRVADAVIAERATRVLRAWGITAKHERVSRPLVCRIRNGRAHRATGLKARAVWAALAALKLIPGVPVEAIARAEMTPRRAAGQAYVWRKKYFALAARLHGGDVEEVKEVPMLTPAILKYFGCERNPVFDEIASPKDVWWGAQHKEAKAILLDAVEQGRFIRLAGRRGAGKSLVGYTVRDEITKRDNLVLVEPSPTIAGMLTAGHLITSIIQAIKRKRDGREELFPEAQDQAKRALAMRYLLVQERKANRKVVLWIDEAHELRAATYLGLKRFLDEVDGLGRRLLSIILIGQNPEAAYNTRARDLSEVTLRLQTYRLDPMHDEIADYVRHKLERAGVRPSEVITPSALKALAARCPFPLDANVLLAQLLIEGYRSKEKPISREHVEVAGPALEDEAEAAQA